MSAMYYRISAQPVHADGSIGFEDRNPLHEHGGDLPQTMGHMAKSMLEFPNVSTWDITIEVDDRKEVKINHE